MKYECVIRRRDRMGMAIAACGPMEWSAEHNGYLFPWTVPPDYKPEPVLVVHVDVFEDDELIGSVRTMRWLYPGQTYPVVYPSDGNDDDAGTEEPDMPKPPGMVLTFDPNDLLQDIRPLVMS